MIYGLHCAISVSDMERSLSFYRDLLGMEVIMELDIEDDRIGKVIGEQGVHCKIIHLSSGGAVIELFQYQPGGENFAGRMKQYDRGITHIGLEVTGFHELAGKLKKNKVFFLGEPVEFRPGVWVAYFKGPDGEVCEIRERITSK
jgi:catechol 2,3-dioxygenase-like lactoylglutathione lyase family enzyme